MTQSREPIDDFVAADPARLDATFPDLNAMMARVTSSPRRIQTPVGFRSRIAAAVLSASAVTTAGIAALTTSAPRLPVLALSETSSTIANASDALPSSGKISSGAMVPYFASDYSFHATDLPSLMSSASVWSLHASIDGRDVARLAATLGLRGYPTMTPGPDGTGATYEVVDGDRGSLTVTVVDDSSLANWYFSSTSASAVSSSGNATTSVDDTQYREWGQQVIASLHDGWTYGSPEVYSYDDVDQARAGASLNYRIMLEGLSTDLGLYLSFDSRGVLLSASGELGEARRVGVYPLMGSHDGARLLQQQNDDAINALESPTKQEVSGSSSPAAGGSSPDGMQRVQSFDAHLTSVVIELWSARVNDGQYLVPTYVYGGTVNDPSDSQVRWTATWPLVAVSEKYIHIDQTEPSPIAISSRR